jgi:hypothetical protein
MGRTRGGGAAVDLLVNGDSKLALTPDGAETLGRMLLDAADRLRCPNCRGAAFLDRRACPVCKSHELPEVTRFEGGTH